MSLSLCAGACEGIWGEPSSAAAELGGTRPQSPGGGALGLHSCRALSSANAGMNEA
jgi:hypothetical protein